MAISPQDEWSSPCLCKPKSRRHKFPAPKSSPPASRWEPGQSAAGCGAAATTRSRSARFKPRSIAASRLIDTAPVYGFGHSEEIVGAALARPAPRKWPIATKVGLDWKDGKPFRNASRGRIRKEIDDSLRRLQTDVIDLYQVHWPDPNVPVEETAGALGRPARGRQDPRHRRQQFLAGADGPVPRGRTARHRSAALQHVRARDRTRRAALCQAQRHHDARLWRALPRPACRHDDETRRFSGDDLRRSDPKFQQPRFGQYLKAVAALDQFAQSATARRVLASGGALDSRQAGRRLCLVGRAQAGAARPGRRGLRLVARRRGHGGDRRILAANVESPVGPEFMAPPEQAAA